MSLVDPHITVSPAARQQRRFWAADLIASVRPAVHAALARTELTDCDDIPRAGVGAALTIRVSRTWGERNWRQALKLAATAVEAVNARVHMGDPAEAERISWLGRDVSKARAVWRGLLRHDEVLLTRVVDRVLDASELGDRAIPESVLFLRGAVAAGVIAGSVPDEIHAELDRFATWLGLLLEPEASADAWAGALLAVRLEPVAPDRAHAVAAAKAALDALPHANLVDDLRAAIDVLSGGDQWPADRAFDGWQPRICPSPKPKLHARPAAHDPLTAYGLRWRTALRDAMARVVHSDSAALSRSLLLLQHQGGKRLRPLVVLAACEASRGDAHQALDAAALVEWLHQASLVLDDIVDEARLRRGGPTLHSSTSEDFAVGVTAWILARMAVVQRELPSGVREHLADAAETLAEGQRSELRHTGDPELSLTGYYRIIEAKTARLFAAAAAMGGSCAGAPDRQRRALHRYGVEAGLAFQIVDDVLDYTGAADQLGKQPGTDLRARKVTLPILLLRERLDARGRDRLASILFDAAHVANDSDLQWVTEQMDAHHIAHDCLQRAHTHRKRAIDALSALDPSPARDVLATLADRFVERDR